jgi:glycosyltransferase involved in cell wall biosynthesis
VPPTISIVTPCLNAAATIGRTVDSVASQGYPGIEHIVVDGGSTDGTLELLAQFPEVKVISEPDEGLSDAVNKGIALATGELVGWLNADDWYLPGALAAVGEAADANPRAEWFTGGCPILDGDGEEMRKGVSAYKSFLLRHYSLSLYLTQNFISCPATFMRADALEQVGPLSLKYRYSVDYDLFLRLARRGGPFVLDKNLAVFVMAPGTLSMTGFDTQFSEHAAQARAHGAGHPIAVATNVIVSRLIVLAYRLLRFARRSG